MQRILVTGGAGFIGSSFVRHVLAEDPAVEIFNLDALTYAGSLENLKDLPAPGRHRFIHGDIRNTALVENLLRKDRVDTIVHFAAETHVDRSILGPAPFIETNIEGTFSLLEAARRVWVEEGLFPREAVRFHHVSTDEVYGSLGPGDSPFSELSPYMPNSPYAASKAASDHLVRAYANTYGLPTTISNCSNNYGPHQFPEKLIPLVIHSAMDGQRIPIYGDGQHVRDWLYVEDHCRAIRLVLARGRTGATYNVGGNAEFPNLEIVKRLCSILDARLTGSSHVPHESLVTFVPDRPGHDRRYAMDIGQIHRELGWEPQETLESGLLKTVDWYLINSNWIAAIDQNPTFKEWLMKNYTSRGLETK